MRDMKSQEKRHMESSIDATKSLEIKNLVLSPAREKYSQAISDNYEY